MLNSSDRIWMVLNVCSSIFENGNGLFFFIVIVDIDDRCSHRSHSIIHHTSYIILRFRIPYPGTCPTQKYVKKLNHLNFKFKYLIKFNARQNHSAVVSISLLHYTAVYYCHPYRGNCTNIIVVIHQPYRDDYSKNINYW